MKPEKTIFFAALAAVLAAFGAVPARAQQCDTPYEVIATLRPPRLGVPTVWDAVYGKDDKMLQLASGLPMEGGTVFTVGRVLSKDTFAPEQIVLAEINRRGRVLTEKMYPAKEAEVPVKMIASDGSYVVASNIRAGAKKDRRRVRLSWYAKDGAYRKDAILEDGTYDYDTYGLVPAVDGNGFLVIVHAINHKQDNDQHGMIFRLSKDGKQMWQRAYRPGIPNQLYGIDRLDDDSYLALGRIQIDDKRMAGWVMRLGHDGTVLWQRIYPRGAFSAFKYAASSGQENARQYILMGDAMPLDGGPGAIWVAAVDILGEPLWQRYYRGQNLAFSSAGLMRLPDGRLIVAINARAMDSTGLRDHVRMLVLSSRGVILEDEAYIEGVQARANDFVRGWNGERIVMATIESDSKPLEIEMVGDSFVVSDEEGEEAAAETLAQTDAEAETEGPPAPEEDDSPVLKGWVFVATALDPYDDPCAKKPR